MADKDFDVIIVGAGLSGINAAYLLQTQVPGIRYTILEGRKELGGTWAFWKYPGARSDSASSVFCFTWHSWPHDTDFADASSIQAYAEDAVRTQGIDKHIRFNQRVDGMRWSTAEQLWMLDVNQTNDGNGNDTDAKIIPLQYRTRWIIHCSGYYSYEKAQKVDIPGLDSFGGTVSHPQFWTEADDKAVAGKRVVLIGSGATAVTMLPHLAASASHVTMLQRSPSYVMTLPRRNPMARLLHRWLPRRLAEVLDWYRHMLTEHVFVLFLLHFPGLGRRILRAMTRHQLPDDCPVDVHFNPRYTPFEQRLCMAPGGDFFRALNQPNCDIVTGVIDSVTADGIHLREKDQPDIKADVIITATGLHVQILGGDVPVVDGRSVNINERFIWRSCMVEGIPNAALIIGYVTGTWIPGADVRFRTALSVIKRMRSIGATSAVPTIDPAVREALPHIPVLPNSSGYLVNARDRLPMSSGKCPWVNGRDWFKDAWHNLTGNSKDGIVYTVPDDKKKV
ncbi:flavin-binding monooxygenase [Grosmannia clavigera kw1407]|uniref:Flavin-binding monooxygenase n=1 Tax=Grosmannia clavigera (strain kw1407 / UAMH 11150) TaxID=655863 RepID=F0XCV7_GROCL|nr:flavin-binding monooxygenase [Grosmannia clavigera kw1407]EFX04714.1 flavin-binding monooxygenase [Grosmannia clavigera kw1407]